MFKHIVNRYWFYIVGVIITPIIMPKAIETAALQRGCSGRFGGEMLIPVGIFLVAYALTEVPRYIDELREIDKKEVKGNRNSTAAKK